MPAALRAFMAFVVLAGPGIAGETKEGDNPFAGKTYNCEVVGRNGARMQVTFSADQIAVPSLSMKIPYTWKAHPKAKDYYFYSAKKVDAAGSGMEISGTLVKGVFVGAITRHQAGKTPQIISIQDTSAQKDTAAKP